MSGGVSAIFLPDADNDMRVCHVPAGRLVENATVRDLICQLPEYDELVGGNGERDNLALFHGNCRVFGVVGECVDGSRRKTNGEIGYRSWGTVMAQDILIVWRGHGADVDVDGRLLVRCEVVEAGVGGFFDSTSRWYLRGTR